mmetsp:Transcript_31955/g.48613  ORF Transcript_31955/g.48613 Transcript_31955/m.48613 type:complete len:88 (+) Transcript_31955:372-635(+)
MATTPPIKKPTAIELWNFLMIMVPPMLNTNSITADQMAANPSAIVLVDIITKLRSVRIAVTAKIEYHQPAINFLDDPPHKELASVVV